MKICHRSPTATAYPSGRSSLNSPPGRAVDATAGSGAKVAAHHLLRSATWLDVGVGHKAIQKLQVKMHTARQSYTLCDSEPVLRAQALRFLLGKDEAEPSVCRKPRSDWGP